MKRNGSDVDVVLTFWGPLAIQASFPGPKDYGLHLPKLNAHALCCVILSSSHECERIEKRRSYVWVSKESIAAQKPAEWCFVTTVGNEAQSFRALKPSLGLQRLQRAS